jgi:uncharacterized protein (DUF4415 family)
MGEIGAEVKRMVHVWLTYGLRMAGVRTLRLPGVGRFRGRLAAAGGDAMLKRNDKARANFHLMAERLRRLEAALRDPEPGRDVVPEGWHRIAQSPGPGGKEKVTLWVESDVLRFFRAMGKGHTLRMAEVLATFMHARLAGVVQGPEDVDYYAAEREAEVEDRELIRDYAALLRKERAKAEPDEMVVGLLEEQLRAMKAGN